MMIRDLKVNLYGDYMMKNISLSNRMNIPKKDIKDILETFSIFDILRELTKNSKNKTDIYIKQLITRFNNSIREAWYDDLFLLNVG